MRQRYPTNPQLAAMVERSEGGGVRVGKVFEDNSSVNSGILLPRRKCRRASSEEYGSGSPPTFMDSVWALIGIAALVTANSSSQLEAPRASLERTSTVASDQSTSSIAGLASAVSQHALLPFA